MTKPTAFKKNAGVLYLIIFFISFNLDYHPILEQRSHPRNEDISYRILFIYLFITSPPPIRLQNLFGSKERPVDRKTARLVQKDSTLVDIKLPLKY